MTALLVLVSVVLQSLSFLCLKYGSLSHGARLAVFLALAGAALAARALVWTTALGRADLSHVYPFTAVFQVLVFVYAVFLFHEPAHLHHIAGLAIMMGGLILIARERR